MAKMAIFGYLYPNGSPTAARKRLNVHVASAHLPARGVRGEVSVQGSTRVVYRVYQGWCTRGVLPSS